MRTQRSQSSCREAGWWSLSQRLIVTATKDDPFALCLARHDFDDFGVHLLVVPFAHQHEVLDVGGPYRPGDDVVRLAPPRLALAAGNDAAPLASSEDTPLPVGGRVGDL